MDYISVFLFFQELGQNYVFVMLVHVSLGQKGGWQLFLGENVKWSFIICHS